MNALNAKGGRQYGAVRGFVAFPAEAARQSLADAKRIVVVEGNATAQFAFMLHAYGDIRVDQKLLRYDGRSFTAEYILDLWRLGEMVTVQDYSNDVRPHGAQVAAITASGTL
jgi:pyruvate/2-oxoacid:ferredoxin oxidoreductase alpha subunit